MARRFDNPLAETIAMQQGLDGPTLEEGGVHDGMAPMVQSGDPARTTDPFPELITARRAEVMRDDVRIKRALKIQAAAWGDKWLWGWEVKDKRRGTVWIEGPTIKMANAISRAFGNCSVDCRVFDLGQRWLIYARFVDLETGYTLVRPYMQRKDTGEIGKMDAQRAFDMAFQNAVSKALRNVVVNALPDLVEFCIDEAKDAAIAEIRKDPNKVRAWCLKHMERLGIPKQRAEHAYTRKAEDWTVPDLARISSELQSVLDGMAPAAELWPIEQDDDQGGAPSASAGGAGNVASGRQGQRTPDASEGSSPSASTTNSPAEKQRPPEQQTQPGADTGTDSHADNAAAGEADREPGPVATSTLQREPMPAQQVAAKVGAPPAPRGAVNKKAMF